MNVREEKRILRLMERKLRLGETLVDKDNLFQELNPGKSKEEREKLEFALERLLENGKLEYDPMSNLLRMVSE